MCASTPDLLNGDENEGAELGIQSQENASGESLAGLSILPAPLQTAFQPTKASPPPLGNITCSIPAACRGGGGFSPNSLTPH